MDLDEETEAVSTAKELNEVVSKYHQLAKSAISEHDRDMLAILLPRMIAKEQAMRAADLVTAVTVNGETTFVAPTVKPSVAGPEAQFPWASVGAAMGVALVLGLAAAPLLVKRFPYVAGNTEEPAEQGEEMEDVV